MQVSEYPRSGRKHSGTKFLVVNGRRQMTGYKQFGSMHTGDKSWYAEWEKSDARIQTDGQYA